VRAYVLGVANQGCTYSSDGGALLQAQLCQSQDFARDRDGNVFAVDTSNNRIRRVDAKIDAIKTRREWRTVS
jgi:hypothetical protein